MIVIEGSSFSNSIGKYKESGDAANIKSKRVQTVLDEGKYFCVNANSEDVAQLVHLALCITL